MNARTVLDLAVGIGTLPGSLLQTLVAQQANALTNQGGCPMTLTIPPRAAETVPSVGSAPAVPVVYAESGRTVIALRGEADISTRLTLTRVLFEVIGSRSGDVVIDLAETTFIDTAIVRTLAAGQQLIDRRGSNLTFRSPSRLAAWRRQVCGLTDLIESPEPIQLGPSACG